MMSLSVALIEFEMPYYEVQEGARVVVCAVVRQPNFRCPIFFPFEIEVLTKNHSTGMARDGMHFSKMTSFFSLFV